MSRQRSIAAAFASAQAYEAHAPVQSAVAEALAHRILAWPSPAPRPARPSILELGCGTGLLTRALWRGGLHGDWLITDIAAPMLERCREAVRLPGAQYVLMDAERPAVGGGFDLIASSLALQWCEDLGRCLHTLQALLAPGGVLAFSTLLAGSFAQWQAAHRDCGVEAATPAFLSEDALRRCLDALHGSESWLETECRTVRHRDARDFLGALKGIGAHANVRRAPLAAGTMRQVMRAFETRGAEASYRIAYVTLLAGPR